ncbi:MAG: hypothetical protein AB1896_16930 [Thermodesulfobacteriota bacterium]
MAGPQRSGGQTIAGARKKNDLITVMFMRRVGRVYSLRVSARVLAWTGVFALVFAAASAWTAGQYTQLYMDNQELRGRVSTLAATLEKYEYKAMLLEQYDELLAELEKVELGQAAIGSEEGDSPVEARTAAPLDVALADETVETEAAFSDEIEEVKAEDQPEAPQPPANPPVDAVRLNLWPEHNNTTMRFQYNLQNIQPGNELVSGYMFIVLTNNKSNPPKLVPYPPVEIKEGNPVDFKKGLQFSIRRGKTVRGKVEKLENADDYEQAWVFAYSDEGELLLKKLLPSHDG